MGFFFTVKEEKEVKMPKLTELGNSGAEIVGAASSSSG